MQAPEQVQKEVKEIFSAYLQMNKQRKTPERYAVLEEIYASEGHFEAEELYLQMKEKATTISRATIYNTLELLVDCDLVRRHQFERNGAHYEKSYGYKQHDHIICLDCKKVVEFCDPRIQQIKSMMGEVLHFEIKHHSLNLYGACNGHCGKEKRNLSDKKIV